MRNESVLSKNFFSREYFIGGRKSNYYNYNHYNSGGYWASILAAIKKYRIRGKFLDIGCAFGFLLKKAQPFFEEVHGLDISDFAIEEARKQAPLAEVKNFDINSQNLPFPDGYFDLITCLETLEHTKFIEESLEKIVPKLKQDGYLIISVPLKNTWAGKIFHLFERDASHISIPDEKELSEILRRLNLQVLEKTRCFSTPWIKVKGIPVGIELVLRKKYSLIP